ncbi:related to beta transducin-like protein [Fusarium oxysporum]|uniref:Related to beta transducin-like protein n=2 Tax=Fusarium oxysporum TaxID=5507 RepID=A0A2H3TQZ8_FUSOX|nr:related to beta transducin-like protein [Fusarium oxysporum]
MWLINTGIFKLEEFVNPPSTYAILSHTWEGEEVLFQDMENLKRAKGKAGWNKIQMTCDEARKAGILYAWVDTCCIDKRSSAELSEAINSMFAWYQQASVCYVYFSDLVIPWTSADYAMPDTPEGRVWTDVALVSLERQLRLCRWFTRGWTLQEFIAPNGVVFFDQTWNCIGSRALGSDLRFLDILARLTGIPRSVLEYKRNINTIPVAQKMSWAANRETTRVEDAAYCLLGIFNVNMPLLYGEGSKAFLRLQEEIVQDYDDLSVFAWKQDPRSYGVGILRGCFATSPAEFAHWLNAYIGVGDEESGMQVTDSQTVNGQNPKDCVPCFENRLDSASYKDGSVTWITDFELQINPQLSIPLVLVTGLQWGSSDYRMPTCFDRAKLNSQEYWAVLFGQGQAYSMTGGLNFGDRPVELGRLHKIDGSEPVSKELLKHRNHRQDLMIKKRAALARDLLVFESEYKADGVEELEVPRLLRVLSPVDQSPICDVWIERNWEDFDNCGELEVKVGPCQKSDWE